MEIISSFTSSLLAVIFTCLCSVFALFFAFRSSHSFRKSTCKCVCVCSGCAGKSGSRLRLNGEGIAGEMFERTQAIIERQPGASMMEQLVPEITTHALSYLDYPSLCRLSMTNSSMRKAANDDSAWKLLYHKDFTMEQYNVNPVNGWKVYYAATRTIVNINADFFKTIRERSLPAMGQLWLNADYVKCVHANGELFSGYNAVIQSWELAFNWEQRADFQVRDVRARVSTDMAWVTMKAHTGIEIRPLNITNVFECHNGQWFMVHHHSSVVLSDEEVQQVMHG